jgi:hypothetical protein
MRKLLTLAAVGLLFSGLSFLKADEEGKKVTIEGKGLCAKCALAETKSCQNAVIVTKDGKDTTYYLAPNALSKSNHAKLGFCKATKDEPIKVKVTGTCVKKDDKLVVTAEKIEKLD